MTEYKVTLRCIVRGNSYEDAVAHAVRTLNDFPGEVYVVKPGPSTNTVSEMGRILRAATEGRLRRNEHGRYVIDGEVSPDRKTREKMLMRFIMAELRRLEDPS